MKQKFINQISSYVLLSVMLLIQPFSVSSAQDSVNNELTLTEIIFSETEAGLEPFKSRLLLGEFFLRLDDGDDQGDFILFDRKTREIHSFNHEDKSHLMMKPLPQQVIEFKLDFKVDRKKLVDAPKVNGIIPVQNHFYADNKLCKKSINVSGFLAEATQVLIEYEQVIVEQNKQSLFQVPASVRSSCYMANNYLHVSDYLMQGFPLFVADDQGRQKKLLGFSPVIKNKSIMQQPEGYSLYYPNSSNLQ